MSQENAEIARKPLRVRERSSRTLDQRLSLRFPSLAGAVFRPIARLPPRSRLRQTALVRVIQLAAEAYNRRDLDAVVIGYDPDFEYRPAQSLVDAGLIKPCYQGPSGYRAYVAEAAEVWGTETRFEPTEVIDTGEQLVVLADAPMRGQLSGVPLTQEFAYVTTLKDGTVIRQQEFHHHAEALAAVGLSA
jgi:ketosteroid isomerase-like protein